MKQFYNFFKNRRTKNYLEKAALALVFFLGYQTVFAQVSTYTFTQSVGTFIPITGGTTLGVATGNATTTNLNSEIYPVTLPFNFHFNGVSYNSLNVSTNGFISFGGTSPGTTVTNPLSSSTNTGYDGAISAFGRDLSTFFDISGATGNVSWETVGAAPNREVVIQWRNFRPNSSTSTTTVYAFSFQIRLQETSNIINMVYDAGAYLAGNTNVSGTVQVGLRGASTADFNNRLNATTLEFINSTAGTASSSAQNFHTNNLPPGMPSAGLTYTWTPPSCWAPKDLAVVSWDANSANISWTASISAPSGYDIYYSTSDTAPTSSTTPTMSNVAGTTATLMSLSSATIYNIWIRSNCGSGNNSIWTLQRVLFATKCQPPVVSGTNGATVCPGNTATLSATTTDPSAVLNWYDSQAGGNLLTTGTSYTTSPLTSTIDYYVSAATETSGLQTGKTTYAPNPTSGAGTTNFGLVFDVLNTFTLESVTIYPISSTGASGTVTIDVIDGNGSIVHTKTVNVVGAPSSAPVAYVADLDFIILPGNNYKIRPGSYTGISGLMFDPASNAPGGTGGNYGYPIMLQNLVIIKTSTLTAAPSNTARNDLYYYFYDWKIGVKCESPRTTVTATVDAATCLSTLEADAKEIVKVYPNPFSEVININKPELVKSIKITDVSGKLIRNVNQPDSALRLQDLSQGMYILVLEMKNGSQQMIKVIKK